MYFQWTPWSEVMLCLLRCSAGSKYVRRYMYVHTCTYLLYFCYNYDHSERSVVVCVLPSYLCMLRLHMYPSIYAFNALSDRHFIHLFVR